MCASNEQIFLSSGSDSLIVHVQEGVEFDSDAAAIADGEQATRDIFKDRLSADKPGGEDVVLVVKDTGEAIGSIRMKSTGIN